MQLEVCNLWLEEVEETGELTFPEGASNVDKLNMALDKCDAVLSKRSVRCFTEGWMEQGIEKGLYSKQSTRSSLTLGNTDSPSTLSRASDGTMTTITLSSDNIHDSVAKSIVEAAVFAAYAAGYHRAMDHLPLEKCLLNVFDMGNRLRFYALFKAREKTDWSDYRSKSDGSSDLDSGHTAESR